MELFDKNLEKLHAKLLAVSVVVEKLDPKPALEKIENVLRQKLQSVSEDVNLNRGQAHSLHKDEVTLLKSMEKMLIHLQMACRCPWHKWEERCRKPQWTVRARREPLDLTFSWRWGKLRRNTVSGWRSMTRAFLSSVTRRMSMCRRLRSWG